MTHDAGHARYPHPACMPVEDLLRECEWGRGKSGGPGGQHRNKVQTLVWITHTPTGVEAHADENRSPEANRRSAARRLRLALAVEHRAAVPKGDAWGDARSELWRARCRDQRISCNPDHDDYPSLLAEALDNVFACGFDERTAASRLCCTSSQLVRFVADHPAALRWWNQHRAAKGLHALK